MGGRIGGRDDSGHGGSFLLGIHGEAEPQRFPTSPNKAEKSTFSASGPKILSPVLLVAIKNHLKIPDDAP